MSFVCRLVSLCWGRWWWVFVARKIGADWGLDWFLKGILKRNHGRSRKRKLMGPLRTSDERSNLRFGVKNMLIY